MGSTALKYSNFLSVFTIFIRFFVRYVTENFHNLDYHPLEYYNLKTLGFALVSLTGLQLLARDQLERRIYNETHISLTFKHFPPH